MNIPRFRAAVITIALLAAPAGAQVPGQAPTVPAQAPGEPAIPAASEATVAPTPFVGQGTLAETPTPTPTPAPTPTPVVKYDPPQVNLTGEKVPKSRGVSLTPSFQVPAGMQTQPGQWSGPYVIKGSIHAFSLPPHGFVAQYFFILRVNGKPLIYGMKEVPVNKNYVDVLVYAPSAVDRAGIFALPDMNYKFTDANHKGASTRVEEVTPVTITSASTTFGETPGEPVGGWILRILADDQVVYVGANQDDFSNVTRDNPGYFNKVASLYKDPNGRRPGFPPGRPPGYPPGQPPNHP